MPQPARNDLIGGSHDISRALSRAAGALLHPRMFLLMIWPLIVSLVLWIILGALFGAQVFTGVETYLNQSSLYKSVTGTWPFSILATGLLWVLMFVLAIPLVLVTATLIIGVVAMPMVVKYVAERDYPTLERRRGGTIMGSIWNAIAAVLVLVVLVIGSLPLWFFPPLWPAIPVLLLGFFNQHVFRYDALAEHASADEMKDIIRQSRRRLWSLGIVVGLIGYIPFVGFFSPVFSALAFTYYCLDQVAGRRRIRPPEALAP